MLIKKLRSVFLAIVLVNLPAYAGLLDGVKNFSGAVADKTKSAFSHTKQGLGISDVVDDLERPFIETVVAEKAKQKVDDNAEESMVEPDVEQDILMSRRAGQALEPLERTNEYLESITQKLLENWDGQKKEFAVFVVSDEGYNATARANGGIFIPIDTLARIESEDELAALLSHEIAHLLLEHHAIDDFDVVSDKALKYAQLGLAMKAGMGDGGLSKDFINIKMANYLLTEAFFPRWNRNQENEADLLGTDLLLKSGYSLNGMMTFINKLAASQQEQQELIFEDYMTSEGEGLQSSFNFDVQGLIEDSAAKVQSTLTQRHQSPEERREHIHNYVRKFYQERARPDLIRDEFKNKLVSDSDYKLHQSAFKASKEAMHALIDDQAELSSVEESALKGVSGENSTDSYSRLALYELRSKQGQQNAAMQNLDIAIETGAASYSVYYQKYLNYWQKRQFAKAAEQIAFIENEFGEEEIHLPNKIDAAVRSGNTAELIQAKCLASADTDLIQRCGEANNLQFTPMGL